MSSLKRSRSTACAVSTSQPAVLARPLNLDVGWQLHSQVSIRPERFGALLYHFGTRKLSFVTTPLLLRVVQLLGSSRTARTACVEAGVAAEEMPTYMQALSTLAASSMICEREEAVA
jgi:putative mycofactocin binding protein MftB